MYRAEKTVQQMFIAWWSDPAIVHNWLWTTLLFPYDPLTSFPVPWFLLFIVHKLKHVIEILQQGLNFECSFEDCVAVNDKVQ
jgi:hypothetical protein